MCDHSKIIYAFFSETLYNSHQCRLHYNMLVKTANHIILAPLALH